MRNLPICAALLSATIFMSASASATNIDFTGTLDNVCTLTVPVNGTLQINADGSELNSEIGVADSAEVLVASIGKSSLEFSAPTFDASGAAGFEADNPVTAIKYDGDGLLGAVSSNGYTSVTTSVEIPNIIATKITIDAKVTNGTKSFADGTYKVSTVLTCS